MNTKICTSIEQSKKLLSLGLDPSTADMYWWYSGRRYYVESMDDDDFNKESDIPAWSLSALIKLLPEGFLLMDDQGVANLYHIWVEGFNETHIWKNEPLDAAFETICWLIEQGHIKIDK